MDSHSSTPQQGSATSSALFSAGASSAFTNLQPCALHLSFCLNLLNTASTASCDLQSISVAVLNLNPGPRSNATLGGYKASTPSSSSRLDAETTSPFCACLLQNGMECVQYVDLLFYPSSSRFLSTPAATLGFMLCTKLPCHHEN